jgi:hypothetical protein
MPQLFVFLSCLGVCGSLFLTAEIQMVSIKWIAYDWQAAGCLKDCTQIVQREFKKVKGVDAVTVNQAAGRIDIRWKPKFAFSFGPIDTAMRLSGPGLEELRVRVRGKITHDSNSVTLISEGDGSRFILLGVLFPDPTRYVIEENPASHPIPLPVREELLRAEKNKKLVTVEGMIPQPEQSPPLYLIMEKREIEK